MKPGYVIPVVFALLFGVTSLFEGGGQDGKIGEFRNAVVNRANQDQADAAALAPEPKASIAAAKSSVWSKTEDYDEDDPDALLWAESGADATMGEDGTGDVQAEGPSPFVIRPAKPVFAAAGASVAPERTTLRER